MGCKQAESHRQSKIQYLLTKSIALLKSPNERNVGVNQIGGNEATLIIWEALRCISN
jgi:hypothetical protein